MFLWLLSNQLQKSQLLPISRTGHQCQARGWHLMATHNKFGFSNMRQLIILYTQQARLVAQNKTTTPLRENQGCTYFFFVRLFSAVEGLRWSHASQVLMSTDRGLEQGLRSFWVRVISSPWIRVRRWHNLHSKLFPVRSISCVGCPNHLLASRGPW